MNFKAVRRPPFWLWVVAGRLGSLDPEMSPLDSFKHQMFKTNILVVVGRYLPGNKHGSSQERTVGGGC